MTEAIALGTKTVARCRYLARQWRWRERCSTEAADFDLLYRYPATLRLYSAGRSR